MRGTAGARRTWSFSTAVTASHRFAEVVLQPDPGLYPRLVDDALASGLVRAAGMPPVATAAVHVAGGCFAGLALDGPRKPLAPDRPLPLSSAWLKAAFDTRAAVVMVVPPGTWGEELPMHAELADGPQPFADHRTILDRCRAEGRMFWGIVAVDAGGGGPSQPSP
ncbi:hypothetical protein GCM10009578_091660 [Streptomyces rhizosphaericus]